MDLQHAHVLRLRSMVDEMRSRGQQQGRGPDVLLQLRQDDRGGIGILQRMRGAGASDPEDGGSRGAGGGTGCDPGQVSRIL